MMRLLLLALLALLPGDVKAHALEPGYLELQLLGGDTWRATWRKPQVRGAPMPIDAVLPENCETRRAPAPRFDGRAFVAQWVAVCPGGLAGGVLSIEGLEATSTDTLVRYELEAGKADVRRLTAQETAFTIPAQSGPLAVAANYFVLGVDHILEGADHLLFVFALLLLIRDRWRLVGAITAFTVAHSLTLGAATLGWLVIPSPPVEVFVALSIMYLAAELVAKPDGQARLSERYPWIVSFAFGLLHGLGFASALVEIGLPESDVPLALLAFNLGVEAGQLLFVAVILVIAWIAAKLVPPLMAFARKPGGLALVGAGYAIGGVSAYWVIERMASF